MDIYAFPPIAFILDAAYTGLAALAAALAPLAGAASSALAIVLVTLLVRTALLPLGRLQVRAEITRRRLAPKLRALQKRYKNRPELLQQKTLELYREERTSPLAGIGPALAQAPVLSILYGVFVLPSINGHPNALLDETLLGVPLGRSFASLVGAGEWAAAAVVAILLALIGVTAWFSRRQALQFMEPPTPGDAMAERMQGVTRALSWMPFVTVVFAAIVPLAATLYLVVTTAWTLIERTVLRRRMGLLPPGSVVAA